MTRRVWMLCGFLCHRFFNADVHVDTLVCVFRGVLKSITLPLKQCDKPDNRKLKSRSHMVDYCFRLFTVEINLVIARNLKPIGMIKMQGVTIYLNINERISDDMKIHYDRF